jgi:hypothetical protein
MHLIYLHYEITVHGIESNKQSLDLDLDFHD